MSLSGDNFLKTEELPGAFPSDDAVTTKTASGTPQQNTKLYPDHNLAAHQNVAQVGGTNNSSLKNSGTPSQGQNIAHTTAMGAGSTASPADSDPEHLLRRAGAEGVPASSSTTGKTTSGTPSSAARDSAAQPTSRLASAANPLSGPAVANDADSLGPNNAPDITEDLKAVGSGAATAITAAVIAARDAAIAAKDAAAPVVRSAAEQARQAAGYAAENAGPAASVASEQTKNAAVYTADNASLAAKAASNQAKIAAIYAKDSAVPAANAAANTVQANAPAALGGGPTANTASPRDVAPEVPSQVKSSLVEAGEAPEAASSSRAVHYKGQFEGELLGYAREVDAEDEAARRAQEQFKKQRQAAATKGPRPPAPGTLPRLDSGPQTPSTGAAVILGTETERSFPLGSHPVHEGTGPDAAGKEQLGGSNSSGGPVATDDVRTGEVPQTSSGDGRSAAARRPPPVEDKVPVRASEEQTVGNGPGAYQKLSSGTPSGVGQ